VEVLYDGDKQKENKIINNSTSKYNPYLLFYEKYFQFFFHAFKLKMYLINFITELPNLQNGQ
jgi:hypothetical protein